MKALFEEYGSAILVFIVVIALLAVIVALLATDGPVQDAFSNLISDFFEKANNVLSPPTP